MSAYPQCTAARRARPRRRRLAALAALPGLLLAVAACGGEDPAARWEPGQAVAGSPSPGRTASAAPRTVSLSATGDIVMGSAPGRLPADGGKDFFTPVRKALAADVVMGNLEEPLTDDTGTAKCGANSSGCHQFRVPPGYAKHLADAGFTVLNQANNHGNDYGAAGYRNTSAALTEQGLKHTGAPGEITVLTVGQVKIAVLGFSPYAWNNSSLNLTAAADLVRKADEAADLVVVQVHMGAEGSDKIHVKPGTEMFLGENRGDPIAFAHAVIDAGADLVVGHGPHVLRAMEFYQGRLIAYSLGNFAGGSGTLSRSGRLGQAGILKVSLKPDGTWDGGSFTSTKLNTAGRPVPDDGGQGLALIRQVTQADFPSTGARLDTGGRITPATTG
ncbi:CapA family protein [Plantactinospora sp. KBS50]|uniref:CapA family protein n=1 Tax=Plantactinospora sp. KBS50 TaxID=2024580 RepID=UPI000BAAF04A|nr:CapA family protein [Plantactinospora sp. KBS50]ASW57039.1 capsular biosynthesis protein [Plantactinospora sp. KBS50]